MKNRLQQFSATNSWIFSLLVTGAFFLLFNIIATPLLNSDDDAFFMYLLSGAVGEPPTALLHYNYGWHPWLGMIIKNLFIASPSVNWYAVFLLVLHVAGYTAILYVFLKRLSLL